MLINTLRDFEWVEPSQVVVGRGSSRGYSISQKRAFYRYPEGGLVPYIEPHRMVLQMDIQRYERFGLHLRPSRLVEEHNLAARQASENVETYSMLPQWLYLDAMVVGEGIFIEGENLHLGPFAIDVAQAKEGIGVHEAVDGMRAKQNLLLTGIRVVEELKSPSVLERYVIIPKGVFQLKIDLTKDGKYTPDQISRETGFVEAVDPYEGQLKEGEFYFSSTQSLSYAVLSSLGDLHLSTAFARSSPDIAVRLASDTDVSLTVRALVEAGRLEANSITKKEEIFYEIRDSA